MNKLEIGTEFIKSLVIENLQELNLKKRKRLN